MLTILSYIRISRGSNSCEGGLEYKSTNKAKKKGKVTKFDIVGLIHNIIQAISLAVLTTTIFNVV